MTQAPQDRTNDSLIALRRILRATEIYERKLAHAAGLSPPQLRVLQIVAEKPDIGTTPKTLSVQMGVTQATVTALVDRLVRHGMVTRVPSQTDRRQINVVITTTGLAAVERAPDALQSQYVAAFEALEDWEQAQLVSSLERVAAMLKAGDIDASPVLAVRDIRAGNQWVDTKPRGKT
ncbi:MarR family winged helix-turn-helix transcriptional regulator [Pontibaca salina]|uniref:MarR family transcriptional regulator n=1 Tax=Pontibaca salina TaxID=2795731 RepID=A0A934M075_9RHOB|nr:MarR family transcriptional regulator [Pontibaca salina]MBI6628376.1 MarR family transcriptional regulator [Pontibaca salina]